MKILITRSDGTPTKSKVYAKQFIQEKGISEDCLVQENGQFFYEENEEEGEELTPTLALPLGEGKEEIPTIKHSTMGESCNFI